MFSKYSKIVSLLFFLPIAFVAYFLLIDSNTKLTTISEIKNLNTGKLIKTTEKVQEGDLLERRILVQNNSKETLTNYQYKDTNPLTQETKEYTLTLAPGESKVITEEITANQDLKEIEIVSTVLEASTYTINSIKPTQLNNNFDSLFEIYGENLQQIKQVYFQCGELERFLGFATSSENLLQFNIPAFSLKDGSCKLFVVIDSQNFPTQYNLTVLQDQDPEGEIFLKSIVPNQGIVEKDSLFILTGKGFDDIVAIQIDNGMVLDVEFMEKISDTTMVVNIPAGLSEGEYFFRFLGKNSVQSYPNILFKLSHEK